ncbi:MAG: HAD hydrolase-like protein [Alphaproteobacteria bacterium]|nr:HAD hydrolase-like protein [Alphaproteobacteria bacterium]
MSQKLKYISRVKDEFDSVICGVNGVFMYGNKVDAESLQTLIKFYQSGKKIALASNSSLRVRDLYYLLKRNDVPMNIFYAMITAGELAHFYLKNTHDLGHSYYNLSGFNTTIVNGLNYEKADSIVMADFILAQTDYEGVDETSVMPILEQALHLNLPMLCVGNNTSLVGSKGVVSGMGAIAERYAIMGGKQVIPFGKPDVRIASYLVEGIPAFSKERCLVIGDCMSTDMRMANNFGVKSLLLTNGVHQMGYNVEQQLEELSGSYGLNIDYYAEALRW